MEHITYNIKHKKNRKRTAYAMSHIPYSMKRGFTLIELIVVMAIFLFITGAALGLFLSIITSQKKALAEQQLLNQISYVEEYMSKALRMAAKDSSGACLGSSYAGYSYLLTRSFTTGPAAGFFTGIKFFNQSDNICQEFYWDTTQGILEEVRGAALPVALTSSSMQINSIKFGVDETTGCNGGGTTCPIGDQDSSVAFLQPRVTILLNVLISGVSQGVGATCSSNTDCTVANQACDLSTHKCTATRTIQATVSQRNLNVK